MQKNAYLCRVVELTCTRQGFHGIAVVISLQLYSRKVRCSLSLRDSVTAIQHGQWVAFSQSALP